MKMRKRSIFWSTMMVAGLACVLPAIVRASTLSTEVIGMFPRDVGEFAYADLHQARSLSWFPQLKQQMLPARFRQFEQFLASAGVDPNSQVEEVAWAVVGAGQPADGAQSKAAPAGEELLGVALGSFQPEAAQNYFAAQKLPVVKVRNFSLYAFGGGAGPGDLFFLFLDANTAAFGQRRQLERLIRVRSGDEQGLLTNSEMFPLISEANGSGVVWAVMNAAYARLGMQQLAPEMAQFPQAQQLVAKLRALTVEIIAGTGVEARFQSVCATPDDANNFAALLQAGLLYKRYQVGNSNPDLAVMLDQTRVTPSGDRLNVRLSLTDEQMMGLIRRNTFAVPL
jgi:hypothetical protein